MITLNAREVRQRQAAVREQMAKAGIDILVTGASSQHDFRGILRYLADYYLPVFEEYLVIPLADPVCFFAHDACGADYMAASGTVDDIRIIPGYEYNSDPARCVAGYVKSLKPKHIGLAGAAGFSANFYQSLMRHVGSCTFTDFSHEINALRMIKSPVEIQLSEAAVRLNEDAFHFYLNFVKPGNREIDAINETTAFALRNGAEDIYWMTSSGKIPHLAYLAEAKRKQHVWEEGDYNYIIPEHSAPGGHWGETTHLISLGNPNPDYARAFKTIGHAQQAAAAAIKPGALVGDIADAAEKVLVEEGYMQPRPSSTPATAIGHSQGADVWEFPRIVSGDQTVIQPNMRFNLHPAVILADGAKITSCDCWISTDTVARRLSTLPYEIIAV